MDRIQKEVLNGDFVVKRGSSTMGICGDRIKEGDVMKSIAHAVEMSKIVFMMISYTHKY